MIVNNPPNQPATPPAAPPPQSPPPERPSRATDNPLPERAARATDPVVTGRYQFKTAAYVWFALGAIEIFLGGDFLLRLLGASQSSGFVGFMYTIGDLFGRPFHGIWPASSSAGSYFDPALLAAMLVYLLLTWGILTLLKIITAPKGTKPAV